ncbi:hypothetical protein ACKKBG_A34470 [Auxenochlorella protothecoides x Auxenochlorella symbiontica]
MSSEYKAKLSSLEQACQDGQEYLSAVTAEGSSGDATPIVGSKALMKPFWISQCDSLVFYRARKTGCLISRTHGFGFMIHRLPSDDAGTPRWSAPCFLRLETTGLGLGFGRVHSASVTACMTPKLRAEVQRRRHRTFTGIESGILCGAATRVRRDFLTSPAASYGTVGSGALRGASFDFSYAIGLLTVDEAANAAAYGGPVAASALLEGKVEAPAEMQPLYDQLAAAALATPGLSDVQVVDKAAGEQGDVEQGDVEQGAREEAPPAPRSESARESKARTPHATP